MHKKNKILDLLLELIQVPSITDTSGESRVEALILSKLQQNSKLLQDNSFGLEAISNDPHNRSIVWGLLKGEGEGTVILLNHHDVVDCLDYGSLQSLAFDPEPLKAALKKQNLSPEVKRDLENENWLFGRGTADMKGGLAIQLSLLDTFAQKDHFKGNILFLSVPDEETLSLGMRESVRLLEKLSEKYHLLYQLLINSEPHERKNENLTIYDGSVGKAMAVVYVQGKKAHIGKAFEGLNPVAILSRIVLDTELNSNLSDSKLGEMSIPPSWSFSRDFKRNYDASIPGAAGGYLSFLTLESTPKKILHILKSVSEKAFLESVRHLQSEYLKNYPSSIQHPEYPVHIKFYEELLQDAMTANPDQTKCTLENSYMEIRSLLNEKKVSIPESNFIIIERLLEVASYNTPTIVIALSPPFYPHITSACDDNYDHFKANLEKTLEQYNPEIEHYFMGISDLSYAGLQNEEEIVPFVAPNMPLWHDDFYKIPFESLKKLSMPTIILGPWGKDLHQKTERIYIPDLIETIPSCIELLILNTL
ncbi:M20/M25/M40 family metallo-hydrolase [Sinanaerobacter sp. ZZT-01]|uniref:M20/M25/M40 family metallo-hydrolase n=1 Tax=Sinanaerobacter sp. ZZT-01 TaxID=3111540 RepID=UPI002D77CEA1|nr:M20/M25/M40 family metallo-hydrolase [Sinanaerobacter sp. ZZT-01]WRR93682.1 M20/M25/M40 family metallo-hydrolase [Sinanaerobacter sp. ZZT-01]